VWHSAEAIGHSLAINLAMGAPGGVWAIMLPILVRTVAANPRWREAPPAVAPEQTQMGEMPEEVERFVTTRIDELIDLLHGLKSDKRSLYNTWHDFQSLRAEEIAEMSKGWVGS
jgi:hypothetical protein